MWACSGKGSRTVIVVPAPAAVRIVITPFSSRTRSSMPRRPSPAPFLWIESDSVVRDQHLEVIGCAAYPHVHARRRGVADAIGERFLHRPVDTRAVGIRKVVEVAVDVELRRHVIASGEVPHVPFERRLQPEVVEHARPKSEREESRTVRTMSSTS